MFWRNVEEKNKHPNIFNGKFSSNNSFVEYLLIYLFICDRWLMSVKSTPLFSFPLTNILFLCAFFLSLTWCFLNL